MMKPAIVTISAVVVFGLVAGGAALALGHGDVRSDRMERLDTDGDGAVSVAELKARHQEFVARADANRDGVITREEMQALRAKRRAARQARRFPDANGDGVVDQAEYQSAAAERFAKLDKDGDGALTEDEAKAGGGDHHRGRHRRHGRRAD